MCKDQAEFDAMPKPPTYRSLGRSRSNSPPPSGPAQKPKQLAINYSTFCKKGMDCSGRPEHMGGDGSCRTPFHIPKADFTKVDEIKAHNKAASKASGSK